MSIKERSDGKIGIDLGLKNLTSVPEEICYNSDMQQCTVGSYILHSRTFLLIDGNAHFIKLIN